MKIIPMENRNEERTRRAGRVRRLAEGSDEQSVK